MSLLCVVCLLCFWRLAARLRPHYLAENYGRQFDKKQYHREIRDNPLAWWTARRVSRFKGNINLYLTWATIGLYSGYLLLGDAWPPWLAGPQLQVARAFGGEALLAAAAMHLAVVPAFFLSGLWDSNEQQRVGRLELLLVSPLTSRQFMVASAVAAWTRGRGYLLVRWSCGWRRPSPAEFPGRSAWRCVCWAATTR